MSHVATTALTEDDMTVSVPFSHLFTISSADSQMMIWMVTSFHLLFISFIFILILVLCTLRVISPLSGIVFVIIFILSE